MKRELCIMGIDEAGRGPVLGDLFIGGVICCQKQIDLLEEKGVDDSKSLSAKKRNQLAEIIKQNCQRYIVDHIPVNIIDSNIKIPGKKSLNDLETDLMIDLIIRLKPDLVYIDAIGSKPIKFTKHLLDILDQKKEEDLLESIPEIVAKNKGDSIYTIVGAASILAKVERDAAIDRFKQDYLEFGDIGSGYPSDMKTREFLKRYITKNRKPPKIARKSWGTTIDLMEKLVYQKNLSDFT